MHVLAEIRVHIIQVASQSTLQRFQHYCNYAKVCQTNCEMTVLIIIALCAIAQAGAFQMSSMRRTSVARLSMISDKNFYPFSNKLQTRVNTELLAAKDADDTKNQGARQLLGIKGGSESKNIWAIRLQLCKPVTWIPLIWGVACGAAASGNYHTWNPFGPEQVPSEIIEDAAKAISCMFLSGPILTGYTQTLNDWEDREIDAINEPNRPIPSGAISKEQVIQQIWVITTHLT
jgi:UbiA prenyltransferase family